MTQPQTPTQAQAQTPTAEEIALDQARTIFQKIDVARHASLELRRALEEVETHLAADFDGRFTVKEIEDLKGTESLMRTTLNRHYTTWLERASIRRDAALAVLLPKK